MPLLQRPLARRRFLRHSLVGSAGLYAGALNPALFAQDIRGAERSTIVRTSAGQVQGVRFHGPVEAFYGIPYAGDTSGAARFMAPPPPAPWTGVRETVRVGNRSPQDLVGPITEVAALDRREPLGEDCLGLSVFTPAADGASRPVMVWLHGGGFSSGSGGWLLYDGSNLARSRDVVVVTVNHRLNVFGYLHLGELGGERYRDSGNAGMLDIVAALQWVRDNIGAFGGDPGNVTIFGQSGGAGKVSTLMAMPAAKGLFHKAIAMSGSNLRGIASEAGSEAAERFLAALELNRDQLDRLHGMPMQQLLDAYLNTPGIGTGPVVDGRHLPASPFFPEAPSLSADIPMMLGTTEHEVNFIPATPLDEITQEDLQRRVTQTVGGDEARARELIAIYREGRPDVENVELYQVLASDNSFRRGVIAEADLKSRHSAPTYLYYFRWNSAVRNGRLRAYHCLDIPFAFNSPDECASMTGAGQDRYALADVMSGAFAAFARTGDPNHESIPHWPRYDLDSRATMIMDGEVKAMEDPFGRERQALYEG